MSQDTAAFPVFPGGEFLDVLAGQIPQRIRIVRDQPCCTRLARVLPDFELDPVGASIPSHACLVTMAQSCRSWAHRNLAWVYNTESTPPIPFTDGRWVSYYEATHLQRPRVYRAERGGYFTDRSGGLPVEMGWPMPVGYWEHCHHMVYLVVSQWVEEPPSERLADDLARTHSFASCLERIRRKIEMLGRLRDLDLRAADKPSEWEIREGQSFEIVKRSRESLARCAQDSAFYDLPIEHFQDELRNFGLPWTVNTARHTRWLIYQYPEDRVSPSRGAIVNSFAVCPADMVRRTYVDFDVTSQISVGLSAFSTKQAGKRLLQTAAMHRRWIAGISPFELFSVCKAGRPEAKDELDADIRSGLARVDVARRHAARQLSSYACEPGDLAPDVEDNLKRTARSRYKSRHRKGCK